MYRHSPLLPAVHTVVGPVSLHGTAVSAIGVIFFSITRPVSSLCDEASVGFFAATGAAKATRLIRTGASTATVVPTAESGRGAAVRDTHMDLRQLGWRESG